jgi:hypothetical protein
MENRERALQFLITADRFNDQDIIISYYHNPEEAKERLWEGLAAFERRRYANTDYRKPSEETVKRRATLIEKLTYQANVVYSFEAAGLAGDETFASDYPNHKDRDLMVFVEERSERVEFIEQVMLWKLVTPENVDRGAKGKRLESTFFCLDRFTSLFGILDEDEKNLPDEFERLSDAIFNILEPACAFLIADPVAGDVKEYGRIKDELLEFIDNDNLAQALVTWYLETRYGKESPLT